MDRDYIADEIVEHLPPYTEDYKKGAPLTDEWVRKNFAHVIHRLEDVIKKDPKVELWADDADMERGDRIPVYVEYNWCEETQPPMVCEMMVAAWDFKRKNKEIPLSFPNLHMRYSVTAGGGAANEDTELSLFEAIPLTEEEKEAQPEFIKWWRKERVNLAKEFRVKDEYIIRKYAEKAWEAASQCQINVTTT